MKTWLIVCAAACVAGCSTPLPEGFVEIDDGDYDWRSMSADGVFFASREFARDPDGTLEFWSAVVQKDLEGRMGYVLQSAEAIDASGHPGRALLFSSPGDNRLYFVAVFLTVGRIWLVIPDKEITVFEAGGPRAEVEKELRKLKDFVAARKF